MTRLTCTLLFYAVVLAFTSGTLAGPGCARRLQGQDDCATQCDKNWGWPGRQMGTNRWGNVMEATVTDFNDNSVVTKLCRLRTQSTSATPSASVPVANVAPDVTLTSSSSPVATSDSSSSSLVLNTTAISTSTTSRRSTSSTVSSSSSIESSTQKAVSLFATPTSSSSPPPPPPTTSDTPKFAPETTSAAPLPPSSSPGPSTSLEPSSQQPTRQDPPPATSSVQNTPGGNNNAANGGSSSNSDIDQYLSAHNSVRAQHGAAPLTWSDEAAGKAQQWANDCLFQHSAGSLGSFGENLAAGTGDGYGIAQAIKSWTDEASQYDPNNPQPSHFTQVVWKASTQVGCAMQLCDGIFDPSFGKAKFFVCEYSPQGNIIGQFAQNVQA